MESKDEWEEEVKDNPGNDLTNVNHYVEQLSIRNKSEHSHHENAEHISTENETQIHGTLISGSQQSTSDSSISSNSNNFNSDQTEQILSQNQIEAQPKENQHHQSSNVNSPSHQSHSNQNFQQPSIIIPTNINENENNSNTNPYLQPNNQPNPQEGNNNIANPYLQPNPQEGNNNALITNPQEGNNNASITNPYLQPNPQEGKNNIANHYLQPNPQELMNHNQQSRFHIESVPPVPLSLSDHIVQILPEPIQIPNSQADQTEGINFEDISAIRNADRYLLSPITITSNPQDSAHQQPIQSLPPYLSATPNQLADLDHFSIESVVRSCGENVPWTDFFFHLIAKGIRSKSGKTKLEEFIASFSKKAQEVGEELIDAYIDGNFDYLEKFRVDIGGIAGGRKYLKSNILFKFAIDAYGIYKDNRNSMKVASQELRVINHLINEKSLNRLFVLPCLALITKCGFRMYASSLLPLNPKESLKYGCENLKQSNRIIKKDNRTMNNIFNLIGQTLNLKNHSIAGDKKNTEIICADIEGHLGTDGNYYLVDTTRLFPPEAPFNNSNSNEHLFMYLRPELVKISPNQLNNDCFSVFWNGNEDQKKKEEAQIRELTETIYLVSIPLLVHSIQIGLVKVKTCFEVKSLLHLHHLCLRHLPVVMEKFSSSFSTISTEARKVLNFLFIEMFSRILKWKWYSLRGNEKSKQKQTIEMKNQYFSESNKDRLSNWIPLLNEFFSVRAKRLNNSTQFSQLCSQLLEDVFDQVLVRFCELCGIQFNSTVCSFRGILKSINLPKPKSLKELIVLKNEQELKFGKDSLILASTLLDMARFQLLLKPPNHVESERLLMECLKIYEMHGKQDEWHVLSIKLEIIGFRNWRKENLIVCRSITQKFEDLIGRQHPQFEATILQLAEMLLQQGNFEEALKYFEECLKIQEQTIGKKHPNYATTLANVGSTLQQQGKYEESLKYFGEALKIEERTLGNKHPHYAIILSRIALIFQIDGNLEKALECLEESLNILDTTFENHGTALIRVEKGVVLLMQGKFEEGLKYINESLILLEQTFGKEHPHYAKVLTQVGVSLLKQGKPAEALNYYEECLKIEEQTIGKQHPNYAITLIATATSLLKLDEYEEALKYLEEALKIQEQTIGKPHRHYSETLCCMGTVLEKQGKFEESLKYLKECLKFQEQSIGTQHPDYAFVLSLVGSLFGKLKKFDEAMKYLENALKIQERTIGKQHPNYAKTWSEITFLLSKQGQIEEATDRALFSMEVFSSANPSHSVLVQACKSFSNEKYEESLKYFEKSLKIQEQTIGKQNPDYIATLAFVVLNFSKLGKVDQAIHFAEQCLKLLTLQPQTFQKQPCFALVRINLGTILFEQGNCEEASKHLEEALKHLDRRQTNEYHVPLLITGLAFKRVGNYEKALKYLEECLKIQEQTIGKHHPDYELTFKAIELTSIQKLNNEEAKPCDVCGNRTTDRCEQCKLVYYCSPKHRSQLWETHIFECSNSRRRIKITTQREHFQNICLELLSRFIVSLLVWMLISWMFFW